MSDRARDFDRGFVIVTLSGFPDIFSQFLRSYTRHEPATPCVVVTSGRMTDQIFEWAHGDWPDHIPASVTFLPGVEPFSFPRNANRGIRYVGGSDVLLVNDDVQFTCPGSISNLACIAHDHPEIGVLSPQFTGPTGNILQDHSQVPLRVLTTSTERLAFACVFIRKAVFDQVGYLDERFDGYGRDDDDFCLRVRQTGLKLAVTPEVVVHHGFGHARWSSSFRRVRYPDGGIDPEMTKKWVEKWGDRA